TRLAARLPFGTSPASGALGGSDGETLCDDVAGEAAAAYVVGNGKDRSSVPIGELASLDHAEHVLGELEQADSVGDRWVRPANALADLAEAQAELVDQQRVRPCLFDGGELLARDVLDDADQQGVAVVGLTNERGDGR